MNRFIIKLAAKLISMLVVFSMMPCCFAEMIGGECEDSGKSGDNGKTTAQKQSTDAAQPSHHAKNNVAKPPVHKKPQEPPRRSSAGSSIASSAAPKAPKRSTDKSKLTVAQPSVSEKQKDIPKTHTAKKPSAPEKQQGTPKRPPVERSATSSAAPQAQKTSADKSKSTVGKPSVPKKSQDAPKFPAGKPTTPPYVAPSTEGNHGTEQPIDKDPTTENSKNSLAPPDMPQPPMEEHPFSKIVHESIWKRIVSMPGKVEDLLTEQCIARITDLCTNKGPMSKEELMNLPEILVPNKLKQTIINMVNAPSYFGSIDGFERKSSEQRIGDIVRWYIETGHIMMNFNKMGLDIKNFRKQEDFLTYDQLNDKFQIHHGNINVNNFLKDYNNKFWVFQQLSALSENITPKVELRFEEGKVTYPAGYDKNLQEAIRSLPNGKYVCKLVSDMQGNGFHILKKISQEEIKITNTELKLVPLEDFLSSVNEQDYIVQEYMQQHEAMAALNPTSLNTLRMLVLRYCEEPQILAAMVRIGVNGAIVDNAHQGGICVGVDLSTGKLKKFGIRNGSKVSVMHPNSKIIYEGRQIPYFEEAKVLSKRAYNKVFTGALSGAFDIVITANGPKIIEFNPRWDYKGIQASNGGLGKRFLELRNK